MSTSPEKALAYSREYEKRPEVIERRKKYAALHKKTRKQKDKENAVRRKRYAEDLDFREKVKKSVKKSANTLAGKVRIAKYEASKKRIDSKRENEKTTVRIEQKKVYRKKYDKKPESIRIRKKRESFPEHKMTRKNYARKYRARKIPGEKHRIRCKDQKFRKQLLEKYPYCQKCHSKEKLEIHHDEYVDSDLTKLKVLCRECHRALHLKLNKQRR